jgi:hypothetical protein
VPPLDASLGAACSIACDDSAATGWAARCAAAAGSKKHPSEAPQTKTMRIDRILALTRPVPRVNRKAHAPVPRAQMYQNTSQSEPELPLGITRKKSLTPWLTPRNFPENPFTFVNICDWPDPMVRVIQR